MAVSTLEKLGLVFVAVLLYYVIKFLISVVYTYVIGPAVNRVDFKSKGKWALVTGSTDGIGKRYAAELAARGCDVVLVSRSADKLRATAEELEKEYHVATKTIQVDFGEAEGTYEKIAREIADLEIGTLVNNVGISYAYPEYFMELPDGEKIIAAMVNANIVSVTRMTRLVLPGMLARGAGVIINVGSASSIIPSPLLTVYAASKAYVDKFSEGLSMEYSKNGIIVQCVLPGFVCTNMSKIKKSGFISPTAETFVKSAIGLVGTVSRTTGYFPHAIFVNTINLINSISSSFGLWLVTRSMETSRGRFLRKQQRMEA